jgi:predicted lipoprotein with Yx(FWY)xxD motif
VICAIALLAVLAVAIAGCGGGGSTAEGSGETESASSGGGYGGESSTASAGSEAGSSAGTVVSLGSAPTFGLVLVSSEGLTIYDFHKDRGKTSSCYGACARDWPPLLTEGKPQVGNGAKASLLGTTERRDGTTQVTYAGHPLYTFAEDKKPGEANGNDVSAFGAEWYALEGNGEEPDHG